MTTGSAQAPAHDAPAVLPANPIGRLYCRSARQRSSRALLECPPSPKTRACPTATAVRPPTVRGVFLTAIGYLPV